MELARHVNCRGTSLSGASSTACPGGVAEATFVCRLVLLFFSHFRLSRAEQSGAEQSVNYSMSIVEKLQMKFN